MSSLQAQNLISDYPGFRFHPTDEELLVHYLIPKTLGQHDKSYYDMILEIDVLEYEPWELPFEFCDKFGSEELFFFCQLKHKYSSGDRYDRKTKVGYWKPTGQVCPIISNGEQIGKKKTQVFHEGHMPQGERTKWFMREYHLSSERLGDNHDKNETLPYVVCRIKNNKKPIMGHAPNPVNQEVDHLSYCNNPNNEAADNHEAVAVQPEESVEEFMPRLPPIQELHDNLTNLNTPSAYQLSAEAQEGSWFIDFINDSDNFDRIPSPASDLFSYPRFPLRHM